MAPELLTIPCLQDNYAFALHDPETGATAVIDVPEAAPIRDALASRGWQLSHVFLTHHHWDHVDGLAGLIDDQSVQVIGATADAHRLPPLSQTVAEGDRVRIGQLSAHVIEVPGHTVGHIAFHVPQAAAVFTGDSLMAMGCGRLFEGTPAQMWESLRKLATLPRNTLVCSGHEYTMSNARFAQSLEDDLPPALVLRLDAIARARAAQQPTVPSLLGEELDTNPFLRATDPVLRGVLGMADASDAAVFAALRARKDKF